MNFFHYFKNWFSQNGNSVAQALPLASQGPEREAYELWKRTVWQHNLRKWLYAQYVDYVQDRNKVDEAVQFLCCKMTKGFTWQYNSARWSAQDFRFMFNYLREQSTKLGYLETRSESRPDGCNAAPGNFFHRSMLRPDTNNKENRFGDILVCLSERNGEIVSVKFSTSACREPDCACDKRFGELVKKILSA